MKRVWKSGGARRKAQGGATAEESYDPTNDVSALLTGEELSEEFKEKASTIFEAAVNNEVDKQLALAEAEVHSVFDSAIEEAKTELTEQLDNYLDYVSDQWFEDNKVAIDTGIRSEIAENFISGLKTLFTENYVEVPENKTDVLQELSKQLEELKASLNEQLNSNISLKQELAEVKRHEIVHSVSSDLTVTEVEKLKELAEGISFTDTSDFVSKIETIKESYFPSKSKKSIQQDEEQEETFEVLSESMDVYSRALTRSTQR
jgi:F0F1-type ATP synthase membrane subunit b/b'